MSSVAQLLQNHEGTRRFSVWVSLPKTAAASPRRMHALAWFDTRSDFLASGAFLGCVRKLLVVTGDTGSAGDTIFCTGRNRRRAASLELLSSECDLDLVRAYQEASEAHAWGRLEARESERGRHYAEAFVADHNPLQCSPQRDAMRSAWGMRNYVEPPAGLVCAFVARAAKLAQAVRVESLVLVPSDLGSNWFNHLYYTGSLRGVVVPPPTHCAERPEVLLHIGPGELGPVPVRTWERFASHLARSLEQQGHTASSGKRIN